MAEIFKEAQAFNNNPDRWNHDLSHKIYGSFQMGKLYPVMSTFMMPTDTAKLDIAALLQFMPTATPLQSNVRVIFHAFFQRMKNIVKDFPNFIENLPIPRVDPVAPYILPSVKEFKPGSLHDYLGVPCCVVKHGTESMPSRWAFNPNSAGSDSYQTLKGDGTYQFYDLIAYDYQFDSSWSGYGILLTDFGTSVQPSAPEDGSNTCWLKFPLLPLKCSTDFPTGSSWVIRLCVNDDFGYTRSDLLDFFEILTTSVVEDSETGAASFAFSYSDFLSALHDLNYENGKVIHFDLVFKIGTIASEESCKFTAVNPVAVEYDEVPFYVSTGTLDYFINGSYSLADFPLQCPYATQEFPDAPIKLKAYRYRVYESIYNAFYRNLNGNQPFIVDSQVQYNKYNTNTGLGVDETHYDFFYRNYELDAYTSCLPSPQQGNAPLVGISATGRLTIQDDDGTRSTAQLEDLPNGQQGLAISQIDIANDAHRNIVMSLASSGFTINDLREGNALTKFLETNIRKGFRYIDFIMGHFGKAPKHAEMDMPEFIGGSSIRLDVSKVTNTNSAAEVSNPNDVLGQFAGAAQAFGSSKNSMQYYADDYGYLMVVMCIVPDTCYSQILPKDFLYENPLDFPFPEFANLGYQPIDYREFCPIEAYKDYLMDSDKKITDVFGYQRPQYELVWNPDTLHGQFLTTMNNYAISRFFDGRPELGNDFLTIKPEETQNVFTVTKADNDIAFGQIGFSLIMKRPVPRISLPSIGR